MRKIRIIEHISLDGVIQATGGPNETHPIPTKDGPPARCTTSCLNISAAKRATFRSLRSGIGGALLA